MSIDATGKPEQTGGTGGYNPEDFEGDDTFFLETLESMLNRLVEEGKMLDMTLVQKLFSGEVAIADVLGLEPEQLEAVYGMAYRFYQGGEYEKAATIFKVLMMIDPEEVKYYEGLAASLLMQERTTDAIGVYLAASVIDPENPKLPFYRAQCNIQDEDWIAAEKALQKTIHLIDEKLKKVEEGGQSEQKDQLIQMKEKALMLLETVTPKAAEENPMKYEVNQEEADKLGKKALEDDTLLSMAYEQSKKPPPSIDENE